MCFENGKRRKSGKKFSIVPKGGCRAFEGGWVTKKTPKREASWLEQPTEGCSWGNTTLLEVGRKHSLFEGGDAQGHTKTTRE